MRYGTWAELASISENSLLLKPEDLSFSEAAGLPKSGLVAYGAVKAAGFLSLPVLETAPGKMIRLGEEDVVASKENPALLFRKGSEDAITQYQQAKVAMGGRGHFVTVIGGVDGAFAEGATNQLAHAGRTATKSFKSIFSKFKYTLATVPLTGGVEVLKQLLEEKVKCVVDSKVEIFDLEALLAAVDKVNAHKTKGRLVLVN